MNLRVLPKNEEESRNEKEDLEAAGLKAEDEKGMLRTEFFIAMRKIPSVTHQEHRVISQGPGKKAIFYDPPELAEARAKYVSLLAPYKPAAPAKGPIMLKVYWCYAASKAHPVGSWKTSRPDTDNLIKLFKDCMTRVGVWKDDAQVVMEITGKRYDQIEGVYVKIYEIDPEEEA